MKAYRRHFLIVTEEEVRKELKLFYTDILRDTVKDIIEGLCPVPEVILLKGVDKLTTSEIVSVANMGWSDMKVDFFNADSTNNPVVGIVMYVSDHNKGPQSGKSYLLTEDGLYDNDFKNNSIEV